MTEPAAKSYRGLVRLVPIILATAAVDQLSKLWAVGYLADKGSVEVLGSFFMLTLVYNEGGAMGTSFGSSGYYLISSLLILALVLYYIYVNRSTMRIAIPLSFTAGGAIGNITDRIRLGRVIDFIDIDFFNINLFGAQLDRWWTFNLADTAISCSILFLLVSMLFFRHKKEARGTAPPETPAGSAGT